MKGLIIAAPGGERLALDEHTLRAGAVRKWGDVVHARLSTLPSLALTLDVEPADETSFAIDFTADGKTIIADGLPRQNADVAALVRSLLPADAPRVIAFDQSWSCHVELVHGITPDGFLVGEADHGTPGWNANDPDGLS